MPNDRKIDYIEIPTTDLDAAKSFFGKLMEWEFADYGPEYTCFDDGRISGGFYKSDIPSQTEKGSVLIIFYSKNLEDTLAKVQSLRAEVTREIYSFPGGRRFHFRTSDGNDYAIWSE
jgi:hypothetical protein